MNLMSEEGREGPERSALSASESPTAIHCAKFEAGFRACERSLRIWRDTFPDHRSSGIPSRRNHLPLRGQHRHYTGFPIIRPRSSARHHE